MEDLKKDEIRKKIIEDNCIKTETRKKYFKNKNFKEIRNWLEINNIDRHLTIDLEAANVLITIETPKEPKKILVQIRSTEKNRMGLFGGGIDDSEDPIDTAVRELKEETGIKISKKDLEFLEINEHDLAYSNGDKAHYKSYVYKLTLKEYPMVKIDNESYGFMLLSKDNYKEFAFTQNDDVLQLHKYWWNTIKNELEVTI